MCGIAGIVSLTSAPVRDGQLRIDRMLSLMRHRGPDRTGSFISPDGHVVLGNTRLAIVDVGNNFDVPLYAREDKCVLTYNGEVFNYREERAKLAQCGVHFRTDSDTEVMMLGLHREGPAYLEKLNGFWGFAYFDLERNHLLLSRDLMGEKHVFYTIRDGEFIFASEMNPILAALKSRPGVDAESIASGFRYRVAPSGRTLLKDIHRLKAGCGIEINLDRPQPIHRRHLRLRPEKWFDFFDREPSENDVVELYAEKIKEACRMRLPSEVDFLTTLSGGLDSTLINVFSNRDGGKPVKSLFGKSTIDSPQRDDDLSELEASWFSAKKLKNDHHEFSMIEDDCVPLYRYHAGNSFDGLLCEGTACYQQLAQQVGVHKGRVLIVSDGPDELIGGYEMDISAFRLQQCLIEHPLKAAAISGLAARGWGRKMFPADRRKHLVNWSHLSEHPFAFRPVHGGTTPEVMETLFGTELIQASQGQFGGIENEYCDLSESLDISQRMALSYATNSIPDYFNLRSDRGTMRESVELRLPFLDPRLVELMIATPAQWRFHGGEWTKFVLRRLVERHVGPEVAFRGKYGFAYPAWHIPRLAEKLDTESSINAFDDWSDLGFRSGTKEFLLRPEEARHRWFGYCVAETARRLEDGEFGTEMPLQ